MGCPNWQRREKSFKEDWCTSSETCGKCDDQRHKVEVLYLVVVQSDLQYGSNAYRTSTTLSNTRKNRLIRARMRKRGMRAVVDGPTTTPTSSISSLLNIVPLETRMQLKLLLHTFRCVHTHAHASPLLCSPHGPLKTPPNEPHAPTP